MFEKILYINLDIRPDRKNHIENELNRLDLEYERFPAINISLNGLGCSMSHLEVIKLAKKMNYKNILIFEDDFKFNVTRQEFDAKIKKLFDSNINFDVCFLSSAAVNEKEPIVGIDFLERTLDTQGAEAYIINGHYYDKLIEVYERSVPLLEKTGMHWHYINDRSWVELQKKDMWIGFIERFGEPLMSLK
jgi:glycosyl transferase family 25